MDHAPVDDATRSNSYHYKALNHGMLNIYIRDKIVRAATVSST